MTQVCDDCGKIIALGEWPWCPHERGVSQTVPDDVPGGFVMENGFDQPTRFYSRSEHRAALAARGLEIHAKWAGPNDKHLSRMDLPCATTLANAKALLSRPKASRVALEAHDPVPIEVTTITFERPKCS